MLGGGTSGGPLPPRMGWLAWPSEDGLVSFLEVAAGLVLETGNLSNPWVHLDFQFCSAPQ